MSNIDPKENLEKYQHIDSCPVRNVLSRFTGKWPLLILCALSECGKMRFSELSKTIPDISSKVLSDTLKHLEADKLINRRLYAEIPPRVEYSLTPLAESLMPILSSLIGWALDNFNQFPKNVK